MLRLMTVFSLLFFTFSFTFAGVINIPADYGSIQAGIDAAVNGDTVLVADGTYLENINFKGKAITVASHYLTDPDTSHISNTVIDGSQPSHPDSGSVVSFVSGEDTTSVLYGFTISGGTGTITNTTYDNNPNNPHRAGGGIFCYNAGARISYNIIKNNHISDYTEGAVRGGGVCGFPVGSTAYIIIEGNQINNNSVDGASQWQAGGGGVDLTCSARVQNNMIAHNEVGLSGSSSWGGGLDCWTDNTQPLHVVIDKNHICYNTVSGSATSEGGGINLWSGDFVISNNIIDHNAAGKHGGGIIGYDCNAQIINNTIVMNKAISRGGGMTLINSPVVLINSIVWGNQAGVNSQIDAVSINIAYSNIEGKIWDGVGNISADPAFADTMTFQLSDSSSSIGRGIGSILLDGEEYSAPASDFSGNPRPNPPGSNPDIGAQENSLGLPSVYIQVPEQYATIQAAINSADHGDTVLVADGTYLENINFNGKAITVASHYFFDGDTSHISSTIIDGSSPSHADSGSVVFFVSGEDTNSVIYGFTITNGSGTITEYADGQTIDFIKVGGGILCYQSGARILHNKIMNNNITNDLTAGGGGICGAPQANSSYIIIKNNQITKNSVTGDASWGSGIDITCNARIENNIVSDNKSNARDYVFGAVDCWSLAGDTRTVLINNNKITHNVSTGNRPRGGGLNIEAGTSAHIVNNEISFNILKGGTPYGNGILILNVEGMVTIDKNTIRHNTIEAENGFGGGICLYKNDGSISITNNIISNNSSFYGGGIRNLSSKAEIINNTIVNNTAFGGGGIFSHGANPVIINSILWGNTAETDPQIFGTVDIVYSTIEGDLWEGEGNINTDPDFVDTVQFHLSDTSSCISAATKSFQIGDNSYNAPALDRYGNPRPDPAGTTPDMGAVENENYVDPDAIEDRDSFLPESFVLQQNYPNPFNPSTVISYQLAVISDVELTVYNILGQKVASLVSKRQAAGAYQVEWDATGFASGLYYYRLNTESGFVQTKKLILLR